MDRQVFDRLVEEEWKNVPPHFAKHIENVALLVEDAPTEELLKQEGLGPHQTLLGYYHGIPQSHRGVGYGVGGTVPDTITLFRAPIIREALEFDAGHTEGGVSEEMLRRAIRETLWHEIGHYFGLSEEAIDAREEAGTNDYRKE